jgi:hypothetical protein
VTQHRRGTHLACRVRAADIEPAKVLHRLLHKVGRDRVPAAAAIASAPAPSHDTRRHAQEREQAKREDAEAAKVQEPAGGEHAAAAVEERHVLLRPVQRVVVLGELERERAAPLPRIRAQRPLRGRGRQRYI